MASEVTPILEEHEFQAMLNGCNRKAPTGARNRALLLLMGRLGLRCAEALAVHPRMIRMGTVDGHQVLLLHLPKAVTKGKQARDPLPIPAEVKLALDEWAEHRRRLGLLENGPFFATVQAGRRTGFGGPTELTPGTALSPRYVRDMVKRLGIEVGVEPERAHPHVLRHTALTSLYNLTHDLRLVQQVAGHSTSRMTERYTHVRDGDVARALNAIPEESPRTSPELSDLIAMVDPETLKSALLAALATKPKGRGR
jgi:integrase